YFEATLEVFPPETSSVGRARARHSLGLAYLARVKGSRVENLRRAIACFEEALTVRIRERYPALWANTQEHLARAHRELDQAVGVGSMEAAIACYQAALQVYTQDAYPSDWARLQSGLGLAWTDRRTGDRAQNLAEAAQHFSAALPKRTVEADPIAHRRIALNLAEAEAGREAWEAAHQAYALALEADRSLFAAGIGVRGKDAALALDETREAATRDGYALARLGRYVEAVTVLEQGRARGLAEAQVLAAANPERISDSGRRQTYIERRDAFVAAYSALQTSSSGEATQEALERQQESMRAEHFVAAKAAFDEMIEEIRVACDPADFFQDAVDTTGLLRAAVDRDEHRAAIYLLATPWGGMAVGVFPSQDATTQEPHVAALDLPRLTSHAIEDLLEITPTDDPTEIVGGYTWAQEYNGFGLLADEHDGATLEEVAATMKALCASTWHTSTLVAATQEIVSEDLLAPLAKKPLGALKGAEKRALRLALGDAFLRRELERCLPTLEQVALEPLATWLSNRDVQHLVVVPCGALGVFPHAAMLQTRQWTAASASTGTALDAVTVAPSIRALLRDVPVAPARSGLYALGNPGTRRQDDALIWGDAEARALVSIASMAGADGHWATQDRATRDWLLTALTTGRVVDVASHGEYDYRDPLKSRLLLGRGETVTLADVLGGAVDLRGLRLLILSSCQSGIGDVRGARDEMRSLAVGMLQAGARAVLAALWPVDDRATYLLITRFGQEWLPQLDIEAPAAALGRAQRWLRDVTYDALVTWAKETRQEAAWDAQAGRESVERALITDAAGIRGQGVRLSPTQAGSRVRSQAEMRVREGKGDTRPYQHPVHWAGFQIFGA
ncbi:MAG TPA: CHAT domain-containing protein, partial [Ktedonobacterales bacterium]|nr:CHAT domain-containing protein [Ktedonobacterales bacterium]